MLGLLRKSADAIHEDVIQFAAAAYVYSLLENRHLIGALKCHDKYSKDKQGAPLRLAVPVPFKCQAAFSKSRRL